MQQCFGSRDVDSDSDSHPDSVDSNDFGGLGLAFEKNVGLVLAPFSSFRKSFLKVFFLLDFELWLGAKPLTQREIQKKKDLQKTLPGP